MWPRAFVCIVSFAAIAATTGADATARSAKGEGPTSIVAAFGSIWIGTGSGAVIRIDARTMRLQRVHRGRGFVHSLARGYGAVWALQDHVVRIHPKRGQATVLSDTGSATTFELAVGAGAVWVADDGRDVVDRIDPRLTERTATIRIPGRAVGLAAGHEHALVVSVPTRGRVTGPAGIRLLRRLDPHANRVSPPLVRLECDPGIAITRDATWTTDPCAGTLVRRDPKTLAATGARRVGRWRAPVAGFGSIWLIGQRSVTRVDPETLRVIARIPAGGSVATVGEGAVWLLECWGCDNTVIHRIDPGANRVVATIRVPSSS